MISQEQLADMQTARHATVKRRVRRKKPQRRKVLLVLFLLFLVFGVALPAIGYPVLANRYHEDISLAYAGARELQGGIGLLRTLQHDYFNTKTVSSAQQDFGDALTIFSRLNGDVNLVPGVLSSALGPRLSAAKHLLPLALDAAQAGVAGCAMISMLTSRFRNPMGKGSGLTLADYAGLKQNLSDLEAALERAIEQVKQVQPGDLQVDPSLEDA